MRNEGSVETGVERAKSGPGRRLLVLVNPVSGKGDSRSTWEKTLRLVAAYGEWSRSSSPRVVHCAWGV